MALKDVWFEVPFQVAYPMGLFLLGEIQAVTEYSTDRNAPKIQKQDYDRDGNGTGLRLWKGTVTDPSAQSHKQASFEVVFVANVQPVPSADEIAPGMRPIVLEGLHVKPKMAGQGEFKSIAWNVRASGIMGDTSGAKRPAAEKAA
ncbi:hypothetical protein [Nocardia sp. BMG111209]|uniref:hypothetical protein n=1 Tax=Nocardia sp. BMG111209 TaxID=1160137 RepID=UPI00039C4938|nr:hypothetical protein [Nocardia sp. BMG111209]